MMQYRKKPVHLVLDGLPAHKKAIVRDYVTSTKGELTLHFLPGYAPDLNPDELVLESCQAHWHGKAPLAEGEKSRERIEEQLATLQKLPRLVQGRPVLQHQAARFT
jgi:transposase